MAHSYHHALSSARRWGGTPDDTIAIHTLLYQLPYLLTVLAQMRRVMEARRSGVLISLFHASQQASTMAL